MTLFAVHNQESFSVGDIVSVHQRVKDEGSKEEGKMRTQVFEGMVIAIRGEGQNKTFTVRKIAAGNIGVERIFPLFSPFIEKIEVVSKGQVARSKLYFLRKKPVREMAEITKRYAKRKAAQASSKKKTQTVAEKAKKEARKIRKEEKQAKVLSKTKKKVTARKPKTTKAR